MNDLSPVLLIFVIIVAVWLLNSIKILREYERGVASHLIVTGAAAHNRFVEAEVMARVAQAKACRGRQSSRKPAHWTPYKTPAIRLASSGITVGRRRRSSPARPIYRALP